MPSTPTNSQLLNHTPGELLDISELSPIITTNAMYIRCTKTGSIFIQAPAIRLTLLIVHRSILAFQFQSAGGLSRIIIQ